MRRRCAGLIVLLTVTGLLAALPSLASLSIYMTPEQLAERAERIVEAEVIRTASGFDPERRTLATYVTLKVETTWRGETNDEILVLREPGGRYGDLVHEVDAVPRYRTGERVIAFLEPDAEGVLRTTGMFYGKFGLLDNVAQRELDGVGRILGQRPEQREQFSRADLIAVASHRPAARRRVDRTARPARSDDRSAPRRTVRTIPPEFDRLLWQDDDSMTRSPSGIESGWELPDELQRANHDPSPESRFQPISSSNPTRWTAADAGQAVTVQIEPGGNPLNDAELAVQAITQAIAAWTSVPESRLSLQAGSVNYDYTGTETASPASRYTGVNIVLFDDPYDDIADPSGCSGVLAIGGYWRSGSTGTPVNGVTFHPALQLYVIFNNNFGCFLGNFDNLSEVAAHELGHGLGFGHSTVPDAIMQATAHGGRGSRLGEDDRDAAHCFYPHTLVLQTPDGGESWQSGSQQTLLWSTTTEAGPDDGEVQLEWSTDGGAVWTPIATGLPNDGSHAWTVPDEPGADHRIRVTRPSRAAAHPAPFVSTCSGDASDAGFEILPTVRVAGVVPSGMPGGTGLSVALRPDGALQLAWQGSCSSDAENYVVYEGSLAALRAGAWDHQPVTCDAGVDLSEAITTTAGNRYYLVAPTAGEVEGYLGRASDDGLRPASTAACLPREAAPSCL